MIIYLVRHGESELRDGMNDSDGARVPLSPLGRSEVGASARYLVSQGITRIYASDLSRAQETAKIISVRCRLPIIIDQRLNEHVLSLSVVDKSKRHELMQAVIRDHSFRPPEGESFDQAVARFYNALRAIAALGEERVCIVSHRNIMQFALMSLFNLQELPAIHEGSVSALVYHNHTFRPLFLNKKFYTVQLVIQKILRKLRKLLYLG